MWRGRLRARGVTMVCGALAMTACSGDEGDDDLSGGCDIQLEGCQRAVFQAAAEVREQEGAVMPRVRTITVAQFGRELEAAYEREGEDPWTSAFEVLGFLEPGSSSEEAAIETALEGVAAFYDSGSKGVTILERGGGTDRANDTFILAHEFVHALQDADVGLDAFREQWVTSTDSFLSTKCLTEGEAMVLGLAVLEEAIGPERVNWDLSAPLLESTLSDVAASTAPFFLGFQSLAYPLGMAVLEPPWRARGQSAIDAFYAAPRLSVIDWTEAGGVEGPSRAEPLDCYPTQGPPGYSAIDHDSFGVLGLLSLGATFGFAARDAWIRALAWRSDSIVLFQSDTDAASFAVAWRIRFSDPEARSRFADDAWSLGSDLPLQGVERDLVIHGTTDPAAAAVWLEPTRCGTADELPVPMEENATLAARVLPGRLPLPLPR